MVPMIPDDESQAPGTATLAKRAAELAPGIAPESPSSWAQGQKRKSNNGKDAHFSLKPSGLRRVNWPRCYKPIAAIVSVIAVVSGGRLDSGEVGKGGEHHSLSINELNDLRVNKRRKPWEYYP